MGSPFRPIRGILGVTMVGFHYLQRGLSGMARASATGSMGGHLGAALLSGYFLGEDRPDLEAGVFTAIERDLDRITGGEESIWFDGAMPEGLFDPFPAEEADPALVASIAAALAGNIGAMRQSGHNVIFASLALRALGSHPEAATPAVVRGIRRLVASFDGKHAGRGYYGRERGWIAGDGAPMADASSTPPHPTLASMAETVVDELVSTASQHRRGFGGLFHLINHAAALVELDRCGEAELAAKGLPAHNRHLRLHRALPNLEEELGRLTAAGLDPFTPAYWKKTESSQWSAWLTHRIKTLYGLETLLTLVESEDRRRSAHEAFRYLMD